MIYATAWPFSVHAWTGGSQQRGVSSEEQNTVGEVNQIQQKEVCGELRYSGYTEEVSTAMKDEKEMLM